MVAWLTGLCRVILNSASLMQLQSHVTWSCLTSEDSTGAVLSSEGSGWLTHMAGSWCWLLAVRSPGAVNQKDDVWPLHLAWASSSMAAGCWDAECSSQERSLVAPPSLCFGWVLPLLPLLQNKCWKQFSLFSFFQKILFRFSSLIKTSNECKIECKIFCKMEVA